MIWVNGAETDCLPATDRGLLYGDGVWETIGVSQGRAQLLEWHLERLQAGLHALRIPQPDWLRFQQEILTVCQGQERAVLKVIVTRGAGQRGYNPATGQPPTRILQLSPWPEYPPEYAGQGVRLALCQTRLARQPLLAGFKHLNRLEQVLARAEFGNDYQEGLMCDYAGNVVEGVMSNLFIINAAGEICTPDLSQCGIAGIMRRFIIHVLEKYGIRRHICTLELKDIEQAQALFITNSLIGIWPVREFSGQYYGIPSLIRKLQMDVKALS